MYWRDWVMMERLRCSYSELQQLPAGLREIFHAFMRGEAQAREATKKT